MSEFTRFNLVIRLSKVQQLAISQFSPCRLSTCWTTGRRVASFLSERLTVQSRLLKAATTLLYSAAWEFDRHASSVQHDGTFRQAHDFRCGLLFLMVSGEVQLCTIHLNTDSRLWGWREIEAFEPETRGILHAHVDASFFQLAPHGSPISCVLAFSSLQVGLVLCVLRLV